METQKMNEVFNQWAEGRGIFYGLQSLDVPWKSENISSSLDIVYFGNVSGQKYISPLVSSLKSGETVTASETRAIAQVIFNVYNKNWVKQYETMSFEYDPVGNYGVTETMKNDMTTDEYGHTQTRTDNLSHTKTGTETESPNLTDTRTDNFSHTKTGTETQTPNTVETQTPNLVTNSDVSGFNSSTPVNANIQSTTGTSTTSRTGSDTLTHNTEDTDEGTQTIVRNGQNTLTYNTTNADSGTQTVSEGGRDTHTRNYTLTRSGTLGLVPVQTLVTDERKLWIWNFFNDVVFPDIDKILTLPIY